MGRPKEGWTWNQQIKKRLSEEDLTWETSAGNRGAWKAMGVEWAEKEYSRRKGEEEAVVNWGEARG